MGCDVESINTEELLSRVPFGKGRDIPGLVPAIIQHSRSLQTLMLGYMNREALKQTLELREVVFYSRSRNQLWRKGETSGHVLKVEKVLLDCDFDTVLVLADPQGPTCHLLRPSCFDEAPTASPFASLSRTVNERLESGDAARSYVKTLADKGLHTVSKKIGEEGVEVALATVAESDDRLVDEVADLVFHTTVALAMRGISWSAVEDRLASRAERNTAATEPHDR